MNLTKLGSAAIRLAQRNVLLQRQAFHPKAGVLHRCRSSRSSDRSGLDADIDKPIKFSSSEAATWNAVHSRTGGALDDVPWYQGYVVIASTAIFLIYFLVLREENDVDEKLTRNLSDHFRGEQKSNLEASFNLPKEYAQSRSS